MNQSLRSQFCSTLAAALEDVDSANKDIILTIDRDSPASRFSAVLGFNEFNPASGFLKQCVGVPCFIIFF